MEETINERIARYRKMRGLNQAELAERIGMVPTSYSQMESTGNITTQRLVDIALVLKVDANVLLYGEQEGIVIPPPNTERPIMRTNPPVIPIDEGSILQDDIILTNKEVNLVKLYRTFSADEKKAIDEFLNETYKKSKEKKKGR